MKFTSYLLPVLSLALLLPLAAQAKQTGAIGSHAFSTDESPLMVRSCEAASRTTPQATAKSFSPNEAALGISGLATLATAGLATYRHWGEVQKVWQQPSFVHAKNNFLHVWNNSSPLAKWGALALLVTDGALLVNQYRSQIANVASYLFKSGKGYWQRVVGE